MADFTLNYTGTQVNSAIGNAIDLLDKIYPLGSIYISTRNVSPATFLGGTWQRIKDAFLFCGDTAFPPGTTGGSPTHTLTINEMPSHYHRFMRQQWFNTSIDESLDGSSIYSWKSTEGGTTSKQYRMKEGYASAPAVYGAVGGGSLTVLCLLTIQSMLGREQLNRLYKEVV